MISKSRWLLLLVLAAIAVTIRIISLDELGIEKHYSLGIYPAIAAFFKYLFGWLPFSIGDVIYGAVAAFLLVKTVSVIRKLWRKEYRLKHLKTKWYSIATTVLLIYISFNIFWGLNYNRKGIGYQLGLTEQKYSKAGLAMLDSLLTDKVNESKAVLIRQNTKYFTTAETFDAVIKAYGNVANQYPWLSYKPTSAKASLWGWAGNYLGFTGYYNPFAGEAQLNTTVPKFIQPFTACHEVAHQLGYAKENEASFVGYLAAVSSGDTLLCYSTYLDMYVYAQGNLAIIDSTKAKYFSKKLLPEARADLIEWKEFNRSHQSPVEPLIRWMYKKYLENNQQPSGLLSYDEVIGFLISYYKKFGHI